MPLLFNGYGLKFDEYAPKVTHKLLYPYFKEKALFSNGHCG